MLLKSIVTQGWRRVVQAAMGLGITAALVACGGGGGSAGDTLFPGNGGSATSDLTGLSIAGNATLANNGTDTLTLKVTALTTGNAALVGKSVAVSFAVSSGAVVTPGGTSTSTTDGTLGAVVSLVDKTSRPVTVTATSGSIKQSFTFNVVDSVTGSKVADISLVADKTALPNNGTQPVVVTATTLDSARSAAGGAPLTFNVEDPVGSNGGAFVTPDANAIATGASNGQLKATVTLGSNKTNRTIKLNAVSGTVTRSISLDVVDSTAVTPTAADLSIALDKATIGNGGSDQIAVTVTAVDDKRNAVKDIDVTFSVDSNAVVVVGNTKTATDGTAKASVTIGADRSNRLVTVTAKSGTFVRQASFRVTGAKLQATLQPATLKVGDKGQVQYTLTDVNSNPMVGASIAVAGPGAAASAAGTTDSRGQYLYSYVAAGSGPTQMSAQSGGAGITSTVQIDAKLSDVPDSVNIASATFTIAPSVVSVNAVGSKDNRSELRLLFLTNKNVPVPNVRVRLGLGDNASGTDGDIGTGKDAVITSDANGVAVSSFIPGQRFSPTDQVRIYACFGKKDDVESIAACPADRLRSETLTVVESPLSITIGTDSAIGEGGNKLTYVQQFTVLVVDSAGNPKSDVQLTPVIDLPTYDKGEWVYNSILKKWEQFVTASCLAEDSAPDGYRNGTIETFNGASEDVNGNGQLDPRKSDVAIAMVGSTKTDANGTAVLRIEYPKNYGNWVEYSIRITASGVLSPPAFYGRIARPGYSMGTLQGLARFTGVPISAANAEAEPPFRFSPYGRFAPCSSPN